MNEQDDMKEIANGGGYRALLETLMLSAGSHTNDQDETFRTIPTDVFNAVWIAKGELDNR